MRRASRALAALQKKETDKELEGLKGSGSSSGTDKETAKELVGSNGCGGCGSADGTEQNQEHAQEKGSGSSDGTKHKEPLEVLVEWTVVGFCD
jgi:hypothetical protein